MKSFSLLNLTTSNQFLASLKRIFKFPCTSAYAKRKLVPGLSVKNLLNWRMGAEMACFFVNINYDGISFKLWQKFLQILSSYISRLPLEKYFLFLFLPFGFLKTLNMVNHAKRECLVYNKHCKKENIYLLC